MEHMTVDSLSVYPICHSPYRLAVEEVAKPPRPSRLPYKAWVCLSQEGCSHPLPREQRERSKRELVNRLRIRWCHRWCRRWCHRWCQMISNRRKGRMSLTTMTTDGVVVLLPSSAHLTNQVGVLYLEAGGCALFRTITLDIYNVMYRPMGIE